MNYDFSLSLIIIIALRKCYLILLVDVYDQKCMQIMYTSLHNICRKTFACENLSVHATINKL